MVGQKERNSNCSVLFLLRAQYHKSLLGAPPLPRNRTLQEMAEYIFQETSGMPLEVGMHSSTMLNSQFECLQSCARSIKAHCTAARDLGSILFSHNCKTVPPRSNWDFQSHEAEILCVQEQGKESCIAGRTRTYSLVALSFDCKTWKTVKPRLGLKTWY